jgi:hypothetical protein
VARRALKAESGYLEGLPMPSKRFNELQDEFFETSKRLRLAQTPQEKLELLTELPQGSPKSGH